MTTDRFDPVQFWRERLGDSSADLSDVGQRSLGPAYNAYLYRRREEVLREILPDILSKCENPRVLDVGCGNGYWVEVWRQLGIRNLVGVDVAHPQTERLSQRYPDFRFVKGDISELSTAALGESRFDIVTLFDVLYHLVDDEQAGRALNTVSQVMDVQGVLLLFDQIIARDVSMQPHVKFRGRRSFGRLLSRAGLTAVDEVPLFVWLAPPVFGIHYLDLAIHGGYASAGCVMRRSKRLGTLVGQWVSRLDRLLLRWGFHTPNHCLFLIRKE